jgi:hypothetical protein
MKKKTLKSIAFALVAIPFSIAFVAVAIFASAIDTAPKPPDEFVMDEAHVVVTNEPALVASN